MPADLEPAPDGDEDLPVLLTTAEAAVLAAVDPATIRRWKHRRKLAPVARGAHGEHLFALADVFALRRGVDPRTRWRHADA